MSRPKVEKLSKAVVRFTYDIQTQEYRKVYFLSDVHIDNPHCNREKFISHLKKAKAENAIVFIFGDLFCLMNGRYDPRRSKSGIRPEYNRENYLDLVINDTAKILGPYADIIGLISEGNHESNVSKRLETNVLDRLIERINVVEGSNIQRGRYQGFILLRFKANQRSISVVKIYYHHGKWGGVVSKGTQSVARYSSFVPQADIVVTGHTHDSWIVKQPRLLLKSNFELEVKDQVHLKTGTYKEEFVDSQGWAVEKIVVPKSLSFWKAKFTAIKASNLRVDKEFISFELAYYNTP